VGEVEGETDVRVTFSRSTGEGVRLELEKEDAMVECLLPARGSTTNSQGVRLIRLSWKYGMQDTHSETTKRNRGRDNHGHARRRYE
jgi:hypothetical protein